MSESRRAIFVLALAGVLLSGLWTGWLAKPIISGQANGLDGIESGLVDLRFATFGPTRRPNDVVIVAIDDETLLQSSEKPVNTRKIVMNLLEKLKDAAPKVVAVDIVFAEPADSQSDTGLAQALGNFPSVLAAAAKFKDGPTRSEIPVSDSELWPDQAFSSVAETGVVNIVTDLNGTPRHIPLMFMTTRGLQPSLALQVARIYSGSDPVFGADTLSLGDSVFHLDNGFHLPLRLAGPTGTVLTVSASDILAGRPGPDLTGKAVIVGVVATAFGDRFSTPFDTNTPGVEIIATAVAQLLGAEGLRRDDQMRRVEAGAAVSLAILCTLLTLLLPLGRGLPLALALLAGWIVSVWVSFSMGFWLHAALPVASALPPMIVAAVFRYVREKRRADTSRRAALELMRFHPAVLANLITQNPDFLQKPQTRDLVIMFVDLTGFTQISQTIGPVRTQDFLKQFHTHLSGDVEKYGGVVLNYMGDGALVVFGLSANIQAEDGGLQAGFKLVETVSSLGVAHRFAQPLGCRIGLHSGSVVLSRLGHDEQQQVTVTGDNVNLASRLMEVAKQHKASIAATSVFLDAVATPLLRPADKIMTVDVRGREGACEVHLWSA